jgi:hypothetical protein
LERHVETVVGARASSTTIRWHIGLLIIVLGCAMAACAQDNYEIQVYPSETVDPHATMVEIHSNFTIDGRKTIQDGVLPTHHAMHETLEITHGFNSWFETGFYVFTSIQPDGGWQYVGSHIRPRVRVPERWHLPVGVSLSTEFGYARPSFSADTWTWEIRPIIDKKLGRWYFAFNPALEKSFRGPAEHSGVEFAPGLKISYDLFKKATVGIEYYGGLGPIGNFDRLHDQEHQVVPSIDIDFGPNWEFNAGVGVGTTRNTDRLLIKTILGYRFTTNPFKRK